MLLSHLVTEIGVGWKGRGMRRILLQMWYSCEPAVDEEADYNVKQR